MNQGKSFMGELFTELFEMLTRMFSVLLVPVMLVAGYFGIKIIRGEADDVRYVNSSSSSLNNRVYADSISPKTMAYLSAEASWKNIGWFYKNFMPVKNDTVSGWLHIYEERTSLGFEWSFWVNKYDPSTYALVYAGTDELKDMLQYLSMELSQKYCQFMLDARAAAKKVKSIVSNAISQKPSDCDELETLYITGHSLGGYLASFIASELVDSYYAGNSSNTNTNTGTDTPPYHETDDHSVTRTTRGPDMNDPTGGNGSGSGSTYSDLKLSDISSSLSINKVHCMTFGAPGMFVKVRYAPFVVTALLLNKLSGNILSSGDFNNFNKQYDGDNLSYRLYTTNWEDEKISNQSKGRYDSVITQYVNSKDPVGNLLSKYLGQLGTLKKLNIGKCTPQVLSNFLLHGAANALSLHVTVLTGVSILINGIASITAVAGGISLIGALYYHMIWLYANLVS